MTVSAMVVLAVSVPEVPVMVTVAAPVVAVLLAERVRTLEPVTGLVAKAAVTPAGRPDAARVTEPVNPLAGVTVMVSVLLLPFVTVKLRADGESVKLPPVPGTVSAMVAECVTELLVPVMVMLVVPPGVLACDVKFTTLVPLEFSDEGAKLALTPEGNPLTLSDTLPVSPLT